jgi:hypothetical protein
MKRLVWVKFLDRWTTAYEFSGEEGPYWYDILHMHSVPSDEIQAVGPEIEKPADF